MADTKIQNFTAITNPITSDILFVGHDPTGTPVDRQATIADVLRAPNSSEVSVTTGTTLTSTAYSKWHNCSGTTADYTVGLPTAVGAQGQWIAFRFDPALTKLVTLDGNSTETVGGALTRIFWARETAIFVSDNVNWVKLHYGFIPMTCSMRLSANQSIAASTLVLIQLDATDIDNTGRMADTGNHKMVCVRPGNYSIVGTIRYSPLATLTDAECYVANAAVSAGYAGGTYPNVPANGTGSAIAVGIATLAVADELKLVGLQANLSSTNQDVTGGSPPYTSMQAIEVLGW